MAKPQLARFKFRSRRLNNEIAWSAADIKGVLNALADAGVVVMGLESVIEHGDGYIVQAISDLTADASAWRSMTPNAARNAAIADIERNVRNPYADDVWYLVTY